MMMDTVLWAGDPETRTHSPTNQRLAPYGNSGRSNIHRSFHIPSINNLIHDTWYPVEEESNHPPIEKDSNLSLSIFVETFLRSHRLSLFFNQERR
jgi:hypothetical protein